MLTHTHTHTHVHMHVLYTVCLCLYVHAFSHVLLVILSCNNGEHRKVSGQVDESPCWLSPSLSSPSNHLAGRNCFGWGGRSLPLSVSLSLLLAPSYIMGKQERREEEKCGTAASDLWRLAWFGLLVTFELHSSMAWRWLPLRRQFEHINVKHAAWNLQARCHYTVFTQYAPIKI